MVSVRREPPEAKKPPLMDPLSDDAHAMILIGAQWDRHTSRRLRRSAV